MTPDPARPLDSLTVGYLGHYDPAYARNRILIKALERAGASVVRLTDRRRFLARTPRLARLAVRVRPDLLLVGFPGHSDVATAKAASLATRAPVIFDPLTSLWETEVDRHGLGRNRIPLTRYRLTDRISCRLADRIWLDTQAHIDWYVEKFEAPPEKFRRVWLGADDEVMRPGRRRADDAFTVSFYGTFIPLQGIEHIIDAAALVEREDERIRFVLCGHGQTHPSMRDRARGVGNLTFVPSRPPSELARLIADSDLCLGIFGDGEKTRRVIPNKVFDALACERPVITGDTPAVRECLRDGEHAWLCPTGDSQALATAVLEAAADTPGRARVARAGHELFRREFSLDALTRSLPPLIREVLR